MNIVVLTNGQPYHRYAVNQVHERHPIAAVVVPQRFTSGAAPRIKQAYWSARDWLSAAGRGGWRAIRDRRAQRRLVRWEARLKRQALRNELGIDEDYPFAASLRVTAVEDVNSEATARRITTVRADLLILMGCPIIRPPVLTAARLGVLNCHSSLLPDFRGAAPEHWILFTRRHDGAGMTIHWAVDRVDAGDIAAQRSVPVYPGDDPFRLRCRSVAVAPALLGEVLDALQAGQRPARPQVGRGGRAYRAADLTPAIRWHCCALPRDRAAVPGRRAEPCGAIG